MARRTAATRGPGALWRRTAASGRCYPIEPLANGTDKESNGPYCQAGRGTQAKEDRRRGDGQAHRRGEHHPLHRALPQGGDGRHGRRRAPRPRGASFLPAKPRGAQARRHRPHRRAGQAHRRAQVPDRRGRDPAARARPVQALPKEAPHPRPEGARGRTRAVGEHDHHAGVRQGLGARRCGRLRQRGGRLRHAREGPRRRFGHRGRDRGRGPRERRRAARVYQKHRRYRRRGDQCRREDPLRAVLRLLGAPAQDPQPPHPRHRPRRARGQAPRARERRRHRGGGAARAPLAAPTGRLCPGVRRRRRGRLQAPHGPLARARGPLRPHRTRAGRRHRRLCEEPRGPAFREAREGREGPRARPGVPDRLQGRRHR